ncbi:uncharacterized protein [Macaca nemestrina]|uniref:uncharacterized protein isoform X1 n=1 Tax=Macaca nemestrina TaxID=9545 RepID=UPI0039B9183B
MKAQKSAETTVTQRKRGAYGAGCTSECQCVEKNTLECSAKNGSCTCKSGYQGNRCQKVCPDGLWGPECWFSSAPCENGGQCNNNNNKKLEIVTALLVTQENPVPYVVEVSFCSLSSSEAGQIPAHESSNFQEAHIKLSE